jgi:hypothetical protein
MGRERAEWLSIPQAVRESDLARQTILSAGLLGRLEVREFGGRLWVSRASLADYMRQRGNSAPLTATA